MIDININDNNIYFKNIDKVDYIKILKWYNDIEEYKFATGIDKPINIQKLHQKYQEVLISKNEYFSGIYLKSNDKCIGVTRGGINNKIDDALWINSVIIDKQYQRQGYGSIVINLVTEYFKNNYNIGNIYISVVKKNIKAMNFWTKIGFEVFRKMNNHLIIDNEKQDVIIMHKKLNSNKLSS